MDNLISFIICTNNANLLTNCKIFIGNLIIPAGYDIEIIEIKNALSMTSGYNSGIKKSSGKYKVYLHQDVYIINPNFISDMLNIFKNEDIGLIAMVGCKDIPKELAWWVSPTAHGMVYEIRHGSLNLLGFRNVENEYEEIVIADGLLLATQCDIPWRDDILDGWHQYDSSQCLEFIRANKKVVVPKQVTPWVIHDCGVVSLGYYGHYKQIFKNEYINEIEKFTLKEINS